MLSKRKKFNGLLVEFEFPKKTIEEEYVKKSDVKCNELAFW